MQYQVKYTFLLKFLRCHVTPSDLSYLNYSPGIATTVTITDGHPECVENERVCIQMCKQMYPEICISANLLRWSSLEDISNFTEEATRLFDVVVCADCLFFENFHDDLLNVLCNTTHPSGQVILMQPSRAGSLQRFLDKAVDFFTLERLESYDEQVVSFIFYLWYTIEKML